MNRSYSRSPTRSLSRSPHSAIQSPDIICFEYREMEESPETADLPPREVVTPEKKFKTGVITPPTHFEPREKPEASPVHTENGFAVLEEFLKLKDRNPIAKQTSDGENDYELANLSAFLGFQEEVVNRTPIQESLHEEQEEEILMEVDGPMKRRRSVTPPENAIDSTETLQTFSTQQRQPVSSETQDPEQSISRQKTSIDLKNVNGEFHQLLKGLYKGMVSFTKNNEKTVLPEQSLPGQKTSVDLKNIDANFHQQVKELTIEMDSFIKNNEKKVLPKHSLPGQKTSVDDQKTVSTQTQEPEPSLPRQKTSVDLKNIDANSHQQVKEINIEMDSFTKNNEKTELPKHSLPGQKTSVNDQKTVSTQTQEPEPSLPRQKTSADDQKTVSTQTQEPEPSLPRQETSIDLNNIDANFHQRVKELYTEMDSIMKDKEKTLLPDFCSYSDERERIETDLKTLDKLIAQKEDEHNRLLHLRCVKEELRGRLERKQIESVIKDMLPPLLSNSCSTVELQKFHSMLLEEGKAPIPSINGLQAVERCLTSMEQNQTTIRLLKGVLGIKQQDPPIFRQVQSPDLRETKEDRPGNSREQSSEIPPAKKRAKLGTDVKSCNYCGSREGVFKCTICQNQSYCSPECEMRDWNSHWKTCVK
ncbi:neurofilament heavy polypeptide-like [Drosophila bipectinata]|uniref:neurofilament heavy polypeptide-like n=1 Tax=Drosophila bipectinata TaxID=42026 RepID=UPI0038B2D82C